MKYWTEFEGEFNEIGCGRGKEGQGEEINPKFAEIQSNLAKNFKKIVNFESIQSNSVRDGMKSPQMNHLATGIEIKNELYPNKSEQNPNIGAQFRFRRGRRRGEERNESKSEWKRVKKRKKRNENE